MSRLVGYSFYSVDPLEVNGGNSSSVREFTNTNTDTHTNTEKYSDIKNLHQSTASVSVLQPDVVKTFLDILTDSKKLDNEFSNMLLYAAEQQKGKLKSISRLNEVIGNSHDEEKWQKRHLKRYIREVTESNQNQSSESFFLNIVPGLKDKIDGEGIGQNPYHKWNLLGHTHELRKP
jgi:hypothetical protein